MKLNIMVMMMVMKVILMKVKRKKNEIVYLELLYINSVIATTNNNIRSTAKRTVV